MILSINFTNFVMGLFYAIFGGLFYYFTTHADKYNYCSVGPFLDWSKYSMIVCFVVLAVMVLKYLFALCSLTEKLFRIYVILDILGALAVIVCAIALLIKDATNCGDLHILAMVFYIAVLLFVLIAVLFFLYNCLFGTKTSAEYISVSYSQTSYSN